MISYQQTLELRLIAVLDLRTRRVDGPKAATTALHTVCRDKLQLTKEWLIKSTLYDDTSINSYHKQCNEEDARHHFPQE